MTPHSLTLRGCHVPRPTRWIVLTAAVALLGFGQVASAQSVDGPRDGLRLPPLVGVNSPVNPFDVTPARPKAMIRCIAR